MRLNKNAKGLPAMKRSMVLLTLPLWLGTLASCGPVTRPDACAGWRQVQVADATVDYLAAHDPQTLKALIGHQQTGQAKGCWK
jgi:hypothetical protein